MSASINPVRTRGNIAHLGGVLARVATDGEFVWTEVWTAKGWVRSDLPFSSVDLAPGATPEDLVKFGLTPADL